MSCRFVTRFAGIFVSIFFITMVSPMDRVLADTAIVAPVYPSNNTTQRSFLRFYQPWFATNGILTLRIFNGDTNELMTSFSGSVSGNASRQLDIRNIETSANSPITDNYPTFYKIEAEMTNAPFGWGLQHVVFSNESGFFAVVQGCFEKIAPGVFGGFSNGEPGRRDSNELINVHTSRIAQYPSSIFVVYEGEENNLDQWDAEIRLTIRDAANGNLIGDYDVPRTILPNEGIFVSVADIEADLGFEPTSAQPHINVTAEYRVAELSSLFDYSTTVRLYHYVNNLNDNTLLELSDFCNYEESD